MNKEIAMKWADELESGRWKQGKGALNTADKRHCCLGVLCEMAVAAGVRVKKRKATKAQLESDSLAGDYRSYAGALSTPPASVVRWAGMNDSDGNPFINDEAIAEHNDQGASFKKLAKLIRKHAEEL